MMPKPEKIIYPLRLVLIVMFSLMVALNATGQEVTWVTVEGTAPIEPDAQSQARTQAIQAAERMAVAEALATTITVETLLVNLRLSGSILGAIPYGKVVTKTILTEGAIESSDDPDHQQLLYRVRIKAGVVQETGGKDPSFHLDAAINQSVFKDGDDLEIHLRSTKDCYFAIFNILDDEKIIRLLPNYLSSKNFLKTDENFTFPDNEDVKKGLRLKVHLPEGEKTVTESIYILALPQPIELDSIKVQEGIFGVFDGQTAFMQDLIREVVTIPLGSRAEAMMQYEIREDKKGI